MKNVKYISRIEEIRFLENDIVIVDRKLLKFPKVKKILRGKIFYAVSSGEPLKDLKSFPLHAGKILSLAQNLSLSDLRLVCMGGGSVGDFGGFIASVLKRGVGLVHIPSTWLAALDSSHGGKTALNVGNYKNQIGTFYPADSVFICKELLFMQPESLAKDAFGELLKTYALDPVLSRSQLLKAPATAETFWKFLRQGIDYKYRIVQKDPFETKGIRTLLNLGHSVGHVFEMLCGWGHGKSILYGLAFDLFWSEENGNLDNEELEKLLASRLWKDLFDINEYQIALSQPFLKVKRLLLQDKKKTSADSIRQVFIKDFGKPKVEKIKIEAILKEYERQKNYFL